MSVNVRQSAAQFDFSKAMSEELLTQGRRNLVCGEIAQAVEAFQKACELLSTEHGDLDEKLAEPNYLYGSALLELARMESTVIGNALVGVPEEDSASESDDLVESGPQMTVEEKEELSNQVIDAMCESSDAQAVDEKPEEAEMPTNEEPESAKENGDEEKEASEGEGEEDEEAASNDEEKAESAEGDADTQEDISNLQLAWEVLEVSKTIYSRKSDDSSKLKVADCLEKLAEISREKEDYEQAVSDLQECLKIRNAILNNDHRDIAETHYQLGTTHAIAGALDLASTSFKKAVACLQHHVDNLKTKITDLEKLDDKAVELESLRNSLKEVETLIPDVQRRCAEVEEDCSAGQSSAGPSGTAFAAKSTEADTTEEVADDISHLVRKKRPVADKPVADSTVSEACAVSNGSPQLKKAKLGTDGPLVNGDAENLNGTAHANGTQNNPATEVA